MPSIMAAFSMIGSLLASKKTSVFDIDACMPPSPICTPIIVPSVHKEANALPAIGYTSEQPGIGISLRNSRLTTSTTDTEVAGVKL